MSTFDRSHLKLQGDGRPFSRGPVTPVALLKSADVTPLIEHLPLTPEKRTVLHNAIWRVMASYLGPLVLAEKLASRASSLKLLPTIRKGSAKLADQLASLDHEFLKALEQHRFEGNGKAEPPMFDFFIFTETLRRLSSAASRAGKAIKPNSRGAPARKHLDTAVEALLVAINVAGLPVDLINSGSAASRRQIKGTGGELLLAIFARFDPHTDQSWLAGSFIRVRKAPRNAKPKPSQPTRADT